MKFEFARQVNAALLRCGSSAGLAGATLLSLARIVGTGAHRCADGKRPEHEAVVVLCSGPSLNSSLVELRKCNTGNVSFISVNDFYKNACFGEFRPRIHVIADPVYWEARSFEDYAGPLARSLGGIDWNLRLCLPHLARGSMLNSALDEHRISYSFFPTAAVKSFASVERLLFRSRLGMPAVQNVLVAALALSMWEGYRRVAIVGADHSWHEEIVMGADNILRVRTSHSYANASLDVPFAKPSSMWKVQCGDVLSREEVFSVREILLAWARVHESYESLADLSRYLGVRIVNCSAKSFVDAFDREQLASFIGDSGVSS